MSEFPPPSLRYRGAVQRVSLSRRLVSPSPPTDGLSDRPTPIPDGVEKMGKKKKLRRRGRKATSEGEDRQHFSTLGGLAHTCAVAVISLRLGMNLIISKCGQNHMQTQFNNIQLSLSVPKKSRQCEGACCSPLGELLQNE